MARSALVTSMVLALGLTFVAAQTPLPASVPASSPADKLAPFLKAMNASDNPSDVMAAYARGSAVDRNNPALHEAYIKRMLKLGQPLIAFYAARTLLSLDKENALAWGVVAYAQARKGEYDDALVSAIRSVIKDRDNIGNLHNAGQLVAWYDMQAAPPELSIFLRQALQRDHDALMAKPAFEKAYNGFIAASKEQQRLNDQARQQLNAAENALLAAQLAALDFDRSLRDLSGQIDQRMRTLNVLNSQMNYSYYTSYGLFIPRGYFPGGTIGYPGGWGWQPGYYVYTVDTNRGYRDDLQNQMRQVEGDINDLRARQALINRQATLSLGELSEKAASVEQLRKHVAGILAGGAERKVRWDPPAVDGVVTPEAEGLPMPKAASQPADPETEARQKFGLAQLYLSHDMPAKGNAILREILEKYPKSAAAADARKLLPKP